MLKMPVRPLKESRKDWIAYRQYRVFYTMCRAYSIIEYL